ARAVRDDDVDRALGPVARRCGLRRSGRAGRDQGQCGCGATKRKKSGALHSEISFEVTILAAFANASRTKPMTAEPPAAAADAPDLSHVSPRDKAEILAQALPHNTNFHHHKIVI